jgi:hypothetical protein
MSLAASMSLVSILDFNNKTSQLIFFINYPEAITANVSICVRAGLPKPRGVPDTERFKDTKRWITRQPRLTQIHCCVLGRVNRYFLFTTCLKSTVTFC